MGLGSTESADHPLITLAIRHFNNAPFVAAALTGAFSQTYDPLEILFIDDCSSDDGFAIAQRLAAEYTGRHRVVLARNAKNLGPGGQVMRIRDLARGEIIVFADADDISLPQRCRRVHEAFRETDVLGAISDFSFIDAAGSAIESDKLFPASDRGSAGARTAEEVASGHWGGTTGAILALHRRILEVGVPLDNLRRGEDQVCGFRCQLLGYVKSIPEVLVHRRVHADNLTAPLRETWSAGELRRQYSRHAREAVLVPSAMRRDLLRFVQDGSVSNARAHILFTRLASFARRAKLLRAAQRSSWPSAWLYLCELHRLGISYRDGLRMLLPTIAPRLEMIRKYRQRRIFRGQI